MIKLFNENDTTFETNGEVVLNPTYAVVHKEDNGSYYLDLETQLTEETKTIPAEDGTTLEINENAQITANGNKEAEITTLKGNTTQEGTPTPSSPVPINVVTGSQDINVCGKNIAKSSYVDSTTNNYAKVLFVEFAIKPNTTYTISFNGTNGNKIYSNENIFTTTSYITIDNNRTIVSLTTQSEIPTSQYTSGRGWALFKNQSGNTNANVFDNLQIEKGSTASPYEAYTGQSQLISLGVENLLPVSSLANTTSNGITFTNNGDGSYTLNGTATAEATFMIFNATTEIIANSQLTFSCLDLIDNVRIYWYDNWATISGSNNRIGWGNPYYTTTNNIEKINQLRINISVLSGTTLNNLVLRPQLEKGSKANSFSPYGTTPIELCKIGTYQDFIRKGTGKNLFDISTITENTYIDENGNTGTSSVSNLSDYIKVDSGIQYTLSYTYTTLLNSNQRNICYYDKNKTFISGIVYLPTSKTHTITMPNNAKYLRFSYDKNCVNIMLEKSSTQTLFEPYGFKDKWYLHKEIGKVVLDGSESWQQLASDTWGANGYYVSKPSGAMNWCRLFANYFKDANISSVRILTNGEMAITASSLVLRNNDTTSTNSLQTWLSTHNTIIYYVLATPTYTEITNNELLGQLESFRLLNGLNNITITSVNLTAPITIHYDYVTGGEISLNDYIQPNKILVANTPTGNQPFRITNIEKTRRKIRLQAKHLTYDSENYVIEDSYVVDKTCNQALEHLNNATDNPSPFTTTSDISTINSYRCVRKSLWEAINVVLERWGGHLTRNNWQIGIMNSIGTDNGVVVRYAKNLKNIDVQYDWTNVVTKILPVGYDGLTLDEVYLYSETQYDIPYTKVVRFDQDVDDTPYRDEDGKLNEEAYKEALQNDLRTQAIAYLNENCIPKVNYELNANLEKITDVGDTIQVIDERLGINIMTSLISFDYNCILEKYTTLEFGNFRKSVSDLTTYINTTSTEIADEISSATKVTLQTELEQATSEIWGVLGNSYVLVEGDKILIVDSLPKETATNVIMLNSAGIGFSNTGINGTFTSAWTIDNVLNMANINVINLTADLIKGGALKLGSNLNQNGILEVYDEANNLIAQLDKNGLRMNATDGGYILINTSVGFAGYDRNNNKVYWADGDEFHMKKSVVEEEITLVDKMTIIPITITDGNNNIVNDGIGFVSTL